MAHGGRKSIASLIGRWASRQVAGRSQKESWCGNKPHRIDGWWNRSTAGFKEASLGRHEPQESSARGPGGRFSPDRQGAFSEAWEDLSQPERRSRAVAGPPPHRCDESSTGYSSAGCSPAEPASASPAGSRLKFRGGVCQGRHELHLPLRTDRDMKKHHGLCAVTKRAPGTPSGRSARRGRGVFKKSLTEPTTL